MAHSSIESTQTIRPGSVEDCGCTEGLEPGWKEWYEQEKAHIEGLRREKVKWYAKSRTHEAESRVSRQKLLAVRQELKEVRATAKKSLALESEVKRLTGLLESAGVESRKRSTIGSLRLQNGQLRSQVDKLKRLIKRLEQDNAQLRSKGATLTKQVFGKKSEKKKKSERGGGTPGRAWSKPTKPRARGQQRGKPGHGRSERKHLPEHVEVHEPDKAGLTCKKCRGSYVRSGCLESTLVEVEVKAYQRKIKRSRWIRGCQCEDSPKELRAKPVSRLFPNTSYGVSFWARFIYEVYACFRPVKRVAAWLTGQGLKVSAGTLSSRIVGMAKLFEPLGEALHKHLNDSRLCQADETSWRVQALPGRGKAWLWVGLTLDCVVFMVDASRSAEAAKRLLGQLKPDTILVCDRYAAYSRLVTLLGNSIRLSICWVHARRDVIRCADSNEDYRAWSDAWLDRIAWLYHLNHQRIAHYCPKKEVEKQSKEFGKWHAEIKQCVAEFFTQVREELEGLVQGDARRKPLESFLRFQEGLSVFVNDPQTPMDNNSTEQIIRGPAIGRKLSFGSDSVHGAEFTALMYSVLGTLRMNDMDVLKWLEAYLQACADNGGKPLDDLDPWLPWSLSKKRRKSFLAQAP